MDRVSTPKHSTRQAFLQILAAVVFMWMVLHILDEVATSRILWAAGASSLASTAYIVFCAPHSKAAALYRIFPAYVVALLVGLGARYLATDICSLLPHCEPKSPDILLFELAAACSVGLTLCILVFLGANHPPAAGLAIIMVLDVHNFSVIVTVLLSGLFLGAIRTLFHKHLRDLI